MHASPDAGSVDIYVYSGSSRPAAPTIATASDPQITAYLTVPAARYTIDVLPHGAAPWSAAVASENVTVNANALYSIVVSGKVANATLQFVNSVETAEVSGQTALIVHHASPFVQSAIAPVGVGVYDAATAKGGPPASATEVFAFSLTNPSGAATSGAQPPDGEYFPLPVAKFVACSRGVCRGWRLVARQPAREHRRVRDAGQARGSAHNKTAAQTALAADTTSPVPAGAHVSILAIDTATAAKLIGRLRPEVATADASPP